MKSKKLLCTIKESWRQIKRERGEKKNFEAENEIPR